MAGVNVLCSRGRQCSKYFTGGCIGQRSALLLYNIKLVHDDSCALNIRISTRMTCMLTK